MMLIDTIAETRIVEAIKRGELNGLPGSGRPLELDDDALVPEDLRVAYRILKNAGCLPSEVQTRCEIHDLRRLLAVAVGAERSRALQKLELLMLRLSLARGKEESCLLEESYLALVQERLSRTAHQTEGGPGPDVRAP
jgi:hypothetical protein